MLFCSQLRKNASQTKFVKSKHGNFADFRPFLPRSQVIKKRAARKPLSLSSTTPPVSNVNTQTERMLTDEVNSPQASPSNVHNVFQIQSTHHRRMFLIRWKHEDNSFNLSLQLENNVNHSSSYSIYMKRVLVPERKIRCVLV
ncbi:hypothetical protein RCL_jg1075.t2 [Rhizophagus clarus]|uniref:Chromo domain-containing protein n=1 Tax=Rhizophagus clarus TaxID=94130 RepID=A0A8H3R2P2_9GLOM|nr:hypothetical protein RCL_jg1075.t2 [Rhizophagus clarus]